jgi:hypothetical protein
MKKALFTCLILFSGFSLFAQDQDSMRTYNNEWGLNITAFANQFLSFNNNAANPGAYLFTYKHINGMKAFRLGVGLFFSSTNSVTGPNTAPLQSDGVDVSLRLGFEKRFALDRRWLFTAGGDFLLGFKDLKSTSESNFGTIKIKEKVWSIGLGPVLGIHFRFSPRVSIGTEGTIYLRYVGSKSSTDFGGIGGGDMTDSTKGVNLLMGTPLALYFAIRI